jgi:hypothetical protein
MGKPPTTWKKVELEIARYLGGQRRGADFSERDGSGLGKDDVVDVPGWSIEIKHSKTASYGLACSALDQVDQVYGVVTNETRPVAIIHKGGLRIIEQSVVCIRPKVLYQIFDISNLQRSYRLVYTSYRPLWKKIVTGVTHEVFSYSDNTTMYPEVYVQKVRPVDADPTLPEYPAFIAVSLPNFRNYILSA